MWFFSVTNSLSPFPIFFYSFSTRTEKCRLWTLYFLHIIPLFCLRQKPLVLLSETGFVSLYQEAVSAFWTLHVWSLYLSWHIPSLKTIASYKVLLGNQSWTLTIFLDIPFLTSPCPLSKAGKYLGLIRSVNKNTPKHKSYYCISNDHFQCILKGRNYNISSTLIRS